MTTSPWNMDALAAPPATYEVTPSGTEGIQSLFFDGPPCQGKPTRDFAYLGIPPSKPGARLPAMVLAHGGGGSAFLRWVKLWNSRGYAAISMDTCGCVSNGDTQSHPHHPHGGPPGWGGFDQIDRPVEDQWTFHAVAAVIRAHSLLRSRPEVDPARIGLTGVSWGGYLTCHAAGIDDRFAFAAPVYGCGFLGDNSAWLPEFAKMGTDRAARWLSLWDPSVSLPRMRRPMLWVNGTNDFAYPMDSWRKSTLLPTGPRTLCLRVRMPHGHGEPGENPPEILALADSLFRNKPPLPRIVRTEIRDSLLHVAFESAVPVLKAELNFTTDAGPWLERNWQTRDALLDAAAGSASAPVPPAAVCCYMNLFDERGCVVSSEPAIDPPGSRPAAGDPPHANCGMRP
jgi:dienelactone hydrolase